jgi:hypothetical protein
VVLPHTALLVQFSCWKGLLYITEPVVLAFAPLDDPTGKSLYMSLAVEEGYRSRGSAIVRRAPGETFSVVMSPGGHERPFVRLPSQGPSHL